MSYEAPTFNHYNWLEEVLKVEKEYYKNPVAYEFGNANNNGQARQFTKNDVDWYAGFA